MLIKICVFVVIYKKVIMCGGKLQYLLLSFIIKAQEKNEFRALDANELDFSSSFLTRDIVLSLEAKSSKMLFEVVNINI